jgi:hypothetical protein
MDPRVKGEADVKVCSMSCAVWCRQVGSRLIRASRRQTVVVVLELA